MSPTILVLLLPHICAAISVGIPSGPSESHQVPQFRDMSYSYAATDFSTANGTHIKTITVIKNGAVAEAELRPTHEDADEKTIDGWSMGAKDLTIGARISQYVPYELLPLEAPNRTALRPSRSSFYPIAPETTTDTFSWIPILSTISPKLPQILTTQKSRASKHKLLARPTGSRTRDRQNRGKKFSFEDFAEFQIFRTSEKVKAQEIEATSPQQVEDSPETTTDSAASEPPETTSESMLITSRIRVTSTRDKRRV